MSGRWFYWQRRAAPYLFLSPFILLFAVFMLYPLGRSIMLSFYRTTGGAKHERFVGLANYSQVLADKLFLQAAANTLLFAVGFLILQIPASLLLAVLLNSRRVKMRSLLRLAFFSPYLVGQVFVAVVFFLLLAPRHGLVNRIIGAVVPAIGSEIPWTDSPFLAMPSVILAALWLSAGYGMIYLLAALQNVDPQLYEAAEVDGAGRWARFRHVTLPGIRPVLVFLLLVGTIGALQLFELPYVLFPDTIGGPGRAGMTIVMYLFLHGFVGGDLGYGAAVGWILVLLIIALAAAQLRFMRIGLEEGK